MKKWNFVCNKDEIEVGSRKIVVINNRSIGIFNVNGEFFAIANLCPHKLAPLCQGVLTGINCADQPGKFIRKREGEIIRCPWHGWEFDIKTGKSVFNPNSVRAKTFQVCFENENEGNSLETFPIKLKKQKVMIYI